MPQRNPPWQRDELILALDLYFRHRLDTINKGHEEVEALSDLLNRLPIHPDRPDPDTFRNVNGVYMKLCNFLALDPGYEGKGLDAGGRLEHTVWDEFAFDQERLAGVANAIRASYQEVEPSPPPEVEEELAFPEGKVLYRLHRHRERSRTMVTRAKTRAMEENGRLGCVACAFDFADIYGEVGRGFIEAHHSVPLGDLPATRLSRITDLALVCSNCHRMLHRRRPWLLVGHLASLRPQRHL